MRGSWDNTKIRVRGHVFRIWTACAILAAYVYGWVYVPELLTWWKRTTASVIETGCALLPYPWNDRIEATLGNIGLWVQITLAIVVFRIFVWIVLSVTKYVWAACVRGPRRPVTTTPTARDASTADKSG